MKTEKRMIGRQTELDYLEHMYGYEGSQIIVIYGEKHVGKHHLIQTFCKGKSYLNLSCKDCSENLQMELWCREIESSEQSVTPVERRYDEIFNRILLNYEEKCVLLIDEFQLISKNAMHFLSDLSDYIHKMKEGKELFVILLSSDVNWFEQSIPDECEHAAYDFSGVLRINPLPFSSLREYFSKLSAKDCVQIYSVLGGYAGLWHFWVPQKSFKENFSALMLNENGMLYREAGHRMSDLFREPGAYQTILYAVANGNIQMNEIHHFTGFTRAKTGVYLNRLIQCSVLSKEKLFNSQASETIRNGIYRFREPFLMIWYRILFAHLSLLRQMGPSVFYDKMVKPILDELFHYAFEQCCIEYFEWMNQLKKLPTVYQSYGIYTGKYGMIDLMAEDKRKQRLVCLFKWSDKEITYEDYKWLQYCCMKEAIIPAVYELFSIHGFSQDLITESKKTGNITLVDVNALANKK